MRNYELVVILSPKLEKAKEKKLTDKIKKNIIDLKGKLKKPSQLGQKDLVYPIKKNLQGIYYSFEFSVPEDKISLLDKKIRAEDDILRHLLTKLA
ncbi:30S ribosomal protein S6 [Patescibacteria group bacterium]